MTATGGQAWAHRLWRLGSSCWEMADDSCRWLGTQAHHLWQLGSTRSPAPDIAVHCLEVGMQVVQRLSHIQRHLAPSASEANRFGSMRVEGIKH